MHKVVDKQEGTVFTIQEGQRLKITDPEGQQVCDLVAFCQLDSHERMCAARSRDFEETLLFSTGNFIWSNRSNLMLKILEDTCGRNDFLLGSCSQELFEIMYGAQIPHKNCHDAFAKQLEGQNLEPHDIPTPFHIFMNVSFTEDGKLNIEKPGSKAGDYIMFEAMADLTIGITACSAKQYCHGSKPIWYEVLPPANAH